jgi:hypothetical protein
MIAFMVFMYGMARAKYYDECSRNAFLNAKNSNLKDELKQTILELTAEIEARKETSELLLKAGNELNQLNRLIQKRGKDGRYISK